jgi:hypothetical protein
MSSRFLLTAAIPSRTASGRCPAPGRTRPSTPAVGRRGALLYSFWPCWHDRGGAGSTGRCCGGGSGRLVGRNGRVAPRLLRRAGELGDRRDGGDRVAGRSSRTPRRGRRVRRPQRTPPRLNSGMSYSALTTRIASPRLSLIWNVVVIGASPWGVVERASVGQALLAGAQVVVARAFAGVEVDDLGDQLGVVAGSPSAAAGRGGPCSTGPRWRAARTSRPARRRTPELGGLLRRLAGLVVEDAQLAVLVDDERVGDRDERHAAQLDLDLLGSRAGRPSRSNTTRSRPVVAPPRAKRRTMR